MTIEFEKIPLQNQLQKYTSVFHHFSLSCSSLNKNRNTNYENYKMTVFFPPFFPLYMSSTWPLIRINFTTQFSLSKALALMQLCLARCINCFIFVIPFSTFICVNKVADSKDVIQMKLWLWHIIHKLSLDVHGLNYNEGKQHPK